MLMQSPSQEMLDSDVNGFTETDSIWNFRMSKTVSSVSNSPQGFRRETLSSDGWTMFNLHESRYEFKDWGPIGKKNTSESEAK